MAMTVVNEGEVRLLEGIRSVANSTWKMRLYTAISGGLSDATVLADITPAGGTYTPSNDQAVVYGAASNPAGTAQMVEGGLDFELASGGPDTVLGYFLYDTAGTDKLIKVQPFASSQVMSTPGDTIHVDDTFLLKGSITS